MSFEHDAFISYAHLDNEPLPTKEYGWVTLFHNTLRQRLKGPLGREPAVWRDPKLQGNDVFNDEINNQLGRAAVFVSVLSPRYIRSKPCSDEITSFYKTATKADRIVIGNKCRIFKILKVPLGSSDSLPAGVADLAGKMLGFQFYRLDENNVPIELDPAFSEALGQEFLRSVNTVAWNIKELIEQLTTESGATPSKGIVYLAECARDRREAREMIQAELKRLGYTVLPDRELSANETEYIAEVEEMLSRSALSVHFVGDAYGESVGATEKSIVMLQNEAAVRVSRKGRLRRIISLPALAKGATLPQQTFITALHTEADLQFGADLITGGVQDLKSAIAASLKQLETSTGDSPETDETQVFVMCDPRDTLDAVPLIKSLVAHGAQVDSTVSMGEASQVREANHQLMMNADAIVLFYGAGDDTWRFFQQNEIKKIRGLRRNDPPVVFTYLAAPSTEKKQALAATGNALIDGLEGFSEASLRPLLKALHLDRDGQTS